jgi:hypothetical protein
MVRVLPDKEYDEIQTRIRERTTHPQPHSHGS